MKKRDKKAQKQQAERGIEERERKLMKLGKGEVAPESAEDYERLLLAQPNSSLLWIRYMTHHLEMADIESARAVGNRAITKINYREEDEKYKVWLSMINMEHSYGDSESLHAVFKRACAESSNAKYLHLKLADLYESADDHAGAVAIYERTLKKFKYSKKVWSAFMVYHLRNGRWKEAKVLLSRSMQSLAKKKHIETLQKYAMAEYEYGSADRGRIVLRSCWQLIQRRVTSLMCTSTKRSKRGTTRRPALSSNASLHTNIT